MKSRKMTLSPSPRRHTPRRSARPASLPPAITSRCGSRAGATARTRATSRYDSYAARSSPRSAVRPVGTPMAASRRALLAFPPVNGRNRAPPRHRRPNLLPGTARSRCNPLRRPSPRKCGRPRGHCVAPPPPDRRAIGVRVLRHNEERQVVDRDDPPRAASWRGDEIRRVQQIERPAKVSIGTGSRNRCHAAVSRRIQRQPPRAEIRRKTRKPVQARQLRCHHPRDARPTAA